MALSSQLNPTRSLDNAGEDFDKLNGFFFSKTIYYFLIL